MKNENFDPNNISSYIGVIDFPIHISIISSAYAIKLIGENRGRYWTTYQKIHCRRTRREWSWCEEREFFRGWSRCWLARYRRAGDEARRRIRGGNPWWGCREDHHRSTSHQLRRRSQAVDQEASIITLSDQCFNITNAIFRIGGWHFLYI